MICTSLTSVRYIHRMKTLISGIALFLCACGSASSAITSVEFARTDRVQGQPVFTTQVKGTTKDDVTKFALDKAKNGCPKGLQSFLLQQRGAELTEGGKTTFDAQVAFICIDPNDE